MTLSSPVIYCTTCSAVAIFSLLPIRVAFGAERLAVVPTREVEAASNKSTASFSGNVSWYGPQFHGKKTASGELFDMNKPTAAHRTLPFDTRVLVEDPRTGKTVIVKVNDRGPYVRGRVMDLAREGAKELGTLSQGIVYVDCLVFSDARKKN